MDEDDCVAVLSRVFDEESRSVEARGVANLRSIGGPAMVISSVFLQKGGSRWPLLSRLSGNSSSFLGGVVIFFSFFSLLPGLLRMELWECPTLCFFCECQGEKSIKAIGQGANRMSR